MLVNEEVALFGARRSLVGVVTAPSIAGNLRPSVGVILLNAGLVHRAGPGRIYVKIARELAALGLSVLRFDFSGIGDTPARTDTLCFEKSAVAETQEAMDHLQKTRRIDHFILMGGCSGAFMSFETALLDSRVAGAVLINFQMPDAEDEAASSDRLVRNAAHYYQSLALLDAKSWRRFFTGKSDYTQLARVLRRTIANWFASRRQTADKTNFQRKLRELAERKIPAVFICSQGDTRLKELKTQGGTYLKRLRARGEVVLDIISGADHTFTTHQDQQRLLNVVSKRVSRIARHLENPAPIHRPERPPLFRSALQRGVGEELQSK